MTDTRNNEKEDPETADAPEGTMAGDATMADDEAEEGETRRAADASPGGDESEEDATSEEPAAMEGDRADAGGAPDDDEGTEIPDGWTEATGADYVTEKYDARPVALFVSETADVGVHVVPADPNLSHTETERWRVGSVEGGRDGDDLAPAEPLVVVEGRDAAVQRARAFMDAFENADGDDAERRRAAEDAVAAE